MSADQCRYLVDVIERAASSPLTQPLVSIYPSVIVRATNADVALVARLTGGPPINVNVKSTEYVGFFRDLAREGANVRREFEQIVFYFQRLPPQKVVVPKGVRD